MQNELIPVKKENNEIAVSGRVLHEFLGVSSNYTTWFKRMCEYGFVPEEDFIPKMEESTGGRPQEDHILTLDMAKEIAMLQRTEKGRQARKYFIEVEKAWSRSQVAQLDSYMIADPVTRAERWIQEERKRLELEKEKIQLTKKNNKLNFIVEEKIEQIGFKARDTHRLAKCLKVKLSDLLSYNVTAKDDVYIKFKLGLFKKYSVKKWEDIPTYKFNDVYADIDSVDDVCLL